jgi:fermentation-respiration switch protein FrsA (DUF1100 family)
MKSIVLFAVAGYVALVTLMYLAQRSLLYFPDTTRYTPAAVGLPQAEAVTLTTGDGQQVIVWHVPARGEKPVVLYFQGNAGGLNLRVGRFRELVHDGIGLIALNYRGYGGSTGSPSERGLIADATAAYEFAAARYPVERIALWGESLGTGVAVPLAAERPVARVILESPFTSIADVAAAIYWYVPVRPLIKDPFRSDLRIGEVTAPVLVLHGTQDDIVPMHFGERLYAMIRAPKRFVRLAGAGHNDHDADAYGTTQAVREFLDRKRVN